MTGRLAQALRLALIAGLASCGSASTTGDGAASSPKAAPRPAEASVAAAPSSAVSPAASSASTPVATPAPSASASASAASPSARTRSAPFERASLPQGYRLDGDVTEWRLPPTGTAARVVVEHDRVVLAGRTDQATPKLQLQLGNTPKIELEYPGKYGLQPVVAGGCNSLGLAPPDVAKCEADLAAQAAALRDAARGLVATYELSTNGARRDGTRMPGAKVALRTVDVGTTFEVELPPSAWPLLGSNRVETIGIVLGDLRGSVSDGTMVGSTPDIARQLASRQLANGNRNTQLILIRMLDDGEEISLIDARSHPRAGQQGQRPDVTKLRVSTSVIARGSNVTAVLVHIGGNRYLGAMRGDQVWTIDQAYDGSLRDHPEQVVGYAARPNGIDVALRLDVPMGNTELAIVRVMRVTNTGSLEQKIAAEGHFSDNTRVTPSADLSRIELRGTVKLPPNTVGGTPGPFAETLRYDAATDQWSK